jgi:hypothetical protein
LLKDEYQLQRARIERLIRESFPELVARFDAESPNVKFIVQTGSLNTPQTDIIDWQPSEVAKMSDAEILAHSRAMGGGRF